MKISKLVLKNECESLRLLPYLISLLLNTRARVGEVVEIYNGYKDAYSLIKNIFRKDISPDLNEELRLSDYILVNASMTKIFDEYVIDIQKINRSKIDTSY